MNAADPRLESLLRASAADVDWPPTPDLRAGVTARISAGKAASAGTVASARTASSARTLPRVRFARALLVALLALLVLAGIATALGFRLPGLDIVFVDRLPAAGTGLDLGSPVPLADARNGEDPPRVLLPAALPEPGTAYVLGAGSRRIVTLAWRAADGEPALPGTDLSLTVMAVAGGTDQVFLSKVLGPGTTIEPVRVGGNRGWWIAGAPHDILIMRPDGTAGVLTSRVSGDTLVFARDGTLYRIESALGRDATVAIAASLR